MIRRSLAAPILWVWLALPAAAMDAALINNGDYKSAKPPASGNVDALVIKVQVLLDVARFSPGEIDGKLGENAEKALKAFAVSERSDVRQPLTSGGSESTRRDRRGRGYHRVQDLRQ